ncbi:hypothetical protein [Mycolicibacterium agri]|uniref:Sulfur globule protein n=1 Tax=Mycolicibacterium agri TaxID=36811 RepID=A0A7I9W6L2_MYCAG|nr:hypothetical protein [Mycolicibacterium agri]GFG53039.1 hypothetical protein MAGR_44800 [Mycolicibacterium agri]
MNIKRGVAATLIAGAVGLSSLGLGSGVASAATPTPTWAASHAVDAPTVQTVGWHGRGGWGHHGHGFRGFRGYGPAHFPGWHPWGLRHWGW